MVGVELREILRHLTLANGIIDRRVDQRRLDAEACGPVAIDGQRRGRGIRLLVAGNIGKLLESLQLCQQLGGPGIEFVEI